MVSRLWRKLTGVAELEKRLKDWVLEQLAATFREIGDRLAEIGQAHKSTRVSLDRDRGEVQRRLDRIERALDGQLKAYDMKIAKANRDAAFDTKRRN